MSVHVTRHTEPFAYKERLGYVDSLLSCKVSSYVPELVDWLLLPGMAMSYHHARLDEALPSWLTKEFFNDLLSYEFLTNALNLLLP